ncbi:MAG: enoyl-CoA hydratase/isomerase family protein [Bacteriovoracaceae bacterium]|nr:enoyl-CoA hydratase/isomerase family protein [Bacteriovoracaceae bacterium]
MNPFNQYNTLEVSLNPENRSLTTTLCFDPSSPYFTLEMVVELENLVKWLTTKVEINSVLFKSNCLDFGTGLNLADWESRGEKKLLQVYQRFQRLVYGMFFLPQTIIVDYGNKARGVGAEFGLSADLRLCRNGASIDFSRIDDGLVPMAGGVGFLSCLIGKARAKAWLLSPFPPSKVALLESGFITETYADGESPAFRYLDAIAGQSPMARIQTKSSQLQSMLPELDRAKEYEEGYASGCMGFGDWREAIQSEKLNRKPTFKSPKEVRSEIKRALSEV